MSYFVGYMLEGEAAAWHRSVAEDISERFGTWKVHEKVAPHLTIFYPFDIENVSPVTNFLHEWTHTRKVPGILTLRDFGRFDDTVVFANVESPAPVDAEVRDIQNMLMELAGMPRRGFREWNPHATLAHKVPKETMREIWAYVGMLPKPDFTFPFDNLTLFAYEGERKWRVHEVFRFAQFSRSQ